ncbi:hypothetical protein FAGKG844_180078 [Frankia sp. AgKG'84/4]
MQGKQRLGEVDEPGPGIRRGEGRLDEDNGDPGDGFYRFLPARPGNLAAGGRLQMLAVRGEPTYDTATGQRVGEQLPVAWVDIPHPDPSDAEANPGSVYSQGRALGGTRFLGLEGATGRTGAAPSSRRRPATPSRARCGTTGRPDPTPAS